jgi:hypothetical protein
MDVDEMLRSAYEEYIAERSASCKESTIATDRVKLEQFLTWLRSHTYCHEHGWQLILNVPGLTVEPTCVNCI